MVSELQGLLCSEGGKKYPGTRPGDILISVNECLLS